MLKCSGCGVAVEEHTKYLVVVPAQCNGFMVQVGCDHVTPPLLAFPGAKVFGASGCFHKFMDEWEETLRVCDHEKSAPV